MPGVSVRIVYEQKVHVEEVARGAVAAALQDVAEHCLEDANRTVPFEEGTLQDTGHVSGAGSNAGTVTRAVGYGTPYARYQHEDDSLHHKGKGRSHWLELTVYENQAAYQEFIAAAVRAKLGGG